MGISEKIESSSELSSCNYMPDEHVTVTLKLLVLTIFTALCSLLTPGYTAELCVEQNLSDAAGWVTCGLPKLSPRVMSSFVM